MIPASSIVIGSDEASRSPRIHECRIPGCDCGFGTFAGIGKMDAGISSRKLKALVEGAEIASKRLWRS